MNGNPLACTFLENRFDFFPRNKPAVVFYGIRNPLEWSFGFGWPEDSTIGDSRKTGSDHAPDESLLESVPCVFCRFSLALQPALPAALYVGRLEVLLGERFILFQQLKHGVRQKGSRFPGFVHSRVREDVGAA
ncbi:MAG: hypothetical protein BWY82_00255 [Verrucomicrobia bacterium ADurb.Bin474]|nr:MAG: hypothetical protein BWY82_00255 [Verrucomicrobia bacterium ADurb.Bin474]